MYHQTMWCLCVAILGCSFNNAAVRLSTLQGKHTRVQGVSDVKTAKDKYYMHAYTSERTKIYLTFGKLTVLPCFVCHCSTFCFTRGPSVGSGLDDFPESQVQPAFDSP